MYSNAIFYVLKEGIEWNYIRRLNITGDAIRNFSNKWVNMNVFQLSWKILLDICSEYKLDFIKLDEPMNFNDIGVSIKRALKKISKENYKNYFESTYTKNNIVNDMNNVSKYHKKT